MAKKSKKYDFSGWATKNNIKCGDGRIIKSGAFKVNDGQEVPLVWAHVHDDPSMVLGHAVLENRPEGVYAYCKFNRNAKAIDAKECVRSGSVKSLSIWANELIQNGPYVEHGVIREVSLVLAGANSGARVESVFSHGCTLDEDDVEGLFFMDEPLVLSHSAFNEDEDYEDEDYEDEDYEDEDYEDEDLTVGDVLSTLDDQQKEAIAILLTQAITDDEKDGDEDEGDDDDMKHSIYQDVNDAKENENGMEYLSHSAMEEIIGNAKKCGSFKEALLEYMGEESYLQHSIDTTGMTTATGTQTYGFNDPSMLFPDYKSLSATPEWISRNMDWVNKFMSRVGRVPFSRIKSIFADITEDEARARGYIKGKQKKEEVFTTLKRTTSPQTVYKKQKMDRDDIVDITDFDVVAWIRGEMRIMLNEEIARACLVGDGRPSDSDDKIMETNVRPIVTDVPLFNIKTKITVSSNATDSEIADIMIDEMIKARKKYKGSGNPILWTTEDAITMMLLLKDKNGRRIYNTTTELATALRVSEIVGVELLDGQQVEIEGTKYPLLGVIVNPADYRIGADKGGQINNFEDFDIDFNQMKYLIETRISGALVKPFSALTFGLDRSGSSI